MLIDGAKTAINLGGTILGYYPVKVLPSKTAIMPVNPKLLPRVSRLRLLGDNIHSTRIAFVENTYVYDVDGRQKARSQLSTVAAWFWGLSRSGTKGFSPATDGSNDGCMMNQSLCVFLFFYRVSPSKTPVRPRST
ncbi:hypothetical protein B296_00045297 [Ensete ventricosum]|uniref:Uncharacterized protein n=1 Tax=Ensete ventricosum TaxID=4639 RepID=A0A426XJX1_ENSVE|nr:hypothetical protein B296_00045297 [Ensete ventricosum]